MTSLLPPGAVRVPWVPGAAVSSRKAPERAARSRAERCQRKAALVRQDVAMLEKRARKAKRKRVREALEGELALQLRRVAWLDAAAEATRGELVRRARAIEADLGVDGSEQLEQGVRPEWRRDLRILGLLAELAIIRLALGGNG